MPYSPGMLHPPIPLSPSSLYPLLPLSQSSLYPPPPSIPILPLSPPSLSFYPSPSSIPLLPLSPSPSIPPPHPSSPSIPLLRLCFQFPQAFTYLREDVREFLGHPIRARIKGTTVQRPSGMPKNKRFTYPMQAVYNGGPPVSTPVQGVIPPLYLSPPIV